MPKHTPVKDKLCEDLRKCLVNNDSQQPRFAPIGLEGDLLTVEKLSELFKEICPPKLLMKDKSASYVERTIGKALDSSRLKILAILLVHPSLDTFVRAMKRGFDRFPPDHELPLDLENAKQLFGLTVAQDFVEDQKIFLPLQYKERKTIVYQKNQLKYRPHPIIGEPENIGGGASGKVEGIEVAKGHFEYTNGTVNPRPLRLARKVFEKHNDMASSAVKNFTNENDIGAILKQQASEHKHLMTSRGSLIEKDGEEILTCMLFYERAECNLWQVFSGEIQKPAPPSSLKQKSRLIGQYCDLVHGLNHLHDSDIIHDDIKPANILVTEEFSGNESNYVWKLADYNLSREMDRTKYPRNSSSISGKRPPGTYQAPEVQDIADSRVGWWSDLWSLGCVFLLVLAYADDGTTGVNTFERYRSEYDKEPGSSTVMDRFYIEKENTYELNPGVTRYMNRLRERAERRDDSQYGEGHLVKRALEYLEEYVLITDSEERRRREDGARHGTRKFWELMDEIRDGYESAWIRSLPPSARSNTVESNSHRFWDDLEETETLVSGPTDSSQSNSPNGRRGYYSSSSSRTNSPVQKHRSQSRQHTQLCIASLGVPNILEVKKLLDAEQRPDEICPLCGVDPLHTAILQNDVRSHIELLELFLKDEGRADIRRSGKRRKPLLDIAVEKHQYFPTSMLLRCYKQRNFPVDYDRLLAKQPDRDIRELLQQDEKERNRP